ncbi:hypothetical protein NCAS_0A02070 [Naumovozyma castellii]|uniref:Uncharacterized protein n=1 Tax=Naumovozyma castellii TaxID=27288 RepID=G0V5M7_NAUCA|nr:hypothetical protein NCAS_0A02070 [Naumovozyma castellii CBS 4309]CCC66765.1 hypothetical protein NCAS_0A02070 [Naumovozyma castellii CBS 4309]
MMLVKHIVEFFGIKNGQLSIIDGNNLELEDIKKLNKVFDECNVNVLFIEFITGEGIEEDDYSEEEDDEENDLIEQEGLSFIKFINFGKQIIVNNEKQNYLLNKLVFFLMNLKDKKGSIYLVKDMDGSQDFKNGRISKICQIVEERIQRQILIKSHFNYRSVLIKNSFLEVWCDEFNEIKLLSNDEITVVKKPILRKLNFGVMEGLNEEIIMNQFESEYESYVLDSYHHRYPMGESYHDVAIRMEPLLLELEHIEGNLIILADETVLRIIYGYFMSRNCLDLPLLKLEDNEFVQMSICPEGKNTVLRIPLNN